MSTTTVKTIGSGGDYSTLQSWEDAAPANLTTSIAGGEIWQGQCKNQTFSDTITMSGSTTDATGYKELTTVAGSSFSDNANVQTNALRYDTANGSAIGSSGAYNYQIQIYENYARLTKLQVATTNRIPIIASASAVIIDRCIFESTNTGVGRIDGLSNTTVKNCLWVSRKSSVTAYVDFRYSPVVVGCTYISSVAAATTVFTSIYGTSTLKNCAVFNCSAILSSGITYTTCRTDMASPPSGFTTVAYDTSTGSGFQNITDATRDFRIKSTSAMIDVGTTDSTNGTPDIAGTARPSGSAYDVGCWEYVSAGPAFIPRQPYRINQAVQRASNW